MRFITVHDTNNYEILLNVDAISFMWESDNNGDVVGTRIAFGETALIVQESIEDIKFAIGELI